VAYPQAGPQNRTASGSTSRLLGSLRAHRPDAWSWSPRARTATPGEGPVRLVRRERTLSGFRRGARVTGWPRWTTAHLARQRRTRVMVATSSWVSAQAGRSSGGVACPSRSRPNSGAEAAISMSVTGCSVGIRVWVVTPRSYRIVLRHVAVRVKVDTCSPIRCATAPNRRSPSTCNLADPTLAPKR